MHHIFSDSFRLPLSNDPKPGERMETPEEKNTLVFLMKKKILTILVSFSAAIKTFYILNC